MDAFRELLACPVCTDLLSMNWVCRGCGARFDADEGIPNLRLPCSDRTETVRRFYDRAPFPGYPARDTLHALRARAERSAFARLLDRAIPTDARVAEIGCGTGQMSLYLARADRRTGLRDAPRSGARAIRTAAPRTDVEGAAADRA